MEHLSLLAGGQEHDRDRDRARWEKAAADVLRKAGRMKEDDPDAVVWEKLTRVSLDGVEVPPLGTPDHLDGLPDPGLPGQAPYTRGRGLSRTEAGWDVRAHLADPDPNQAAAAALADLENGVTSLWLSVGSTGIATSDLAQVLEKVYLDLAPVVLDAPSDPVGAAEALAAVLGDRDITAAPGTGLGGDPISAVVRGLAAESDVASVVTRLAELARRHGVLALTVDGTAVHDLGATDSQELGYTLAVGAAYLRLLTEAGGLDVATAASLLEFRYAATDDQFLTIAKLRAARRLWHAVLDHSGAPDAAGQVQHAVTGRPMLTRYDPWVNMLRGTVAAFAAGVGGATSVTVLPFDSALGLPDEFGRRNARNTSALLVAESHVARVTDPAGGSYAVERLTDDLAQAGWSQFGKIEAEGGALASVSGAGAESGLLARIRSQAVEPRQRQVAKRRRPITGVSEFPNLHEELPERRPLPEGAGGVHRYAADFEAMRDDPATTPVFLATLGSIAQHTARATFAANLLAAGGVDTVSAGATDDVEALVAAYRQNPLPVACLAGTDKTYAAWGAAAATALREAGARYLVLAGKPGDKTVTPEHLDDSCALGVDALAFLTRVREELAR
jgi:methylmalonyl-CoA mutase